MLNEQELQVCPQGALYRVRAGDTLFSIANRFGVSVDDLLRYNPQINPEQFETGQEICIPMLQSPECVNGQEYTVVAGDTLFSIAQRFRLTIPEILEANPQIEDPRLIVVGQKLCIPRSPMPFCPGGETYTVVAGDTMSQIARKFNLTLQQLLLANPQITNPNFISVGQRICIPVDSGDRRIITLGATDNAPEAKGTVLLDFENDALMLLIRDLPSPRSLGGDVYRVWLYNDNEENWEHARLRRVDNIWFGFLGTERGLNQYQQMVVSAEYLGSRRRPRGNFVYDINL